MSLKQKVGAGVARIIAFVNQKGGVGKTTSAVNLTAALHAAGRRVLLTMFDGRTNFSAQVAEEGRRHFPGKVFAAAIPRNVRLAEAPSHGLPVMAYDRFSRGAAAYEQVAQEIIAKE